MNELLFSIIIPVYNSEKYLEECLDSVVIQNYTDFELILVNDGSKDRSGQICDIYSQKDTRIKVIHKENGGATSARKCGALASKGKYVLTLDSDDTMENNCLLLLSEIISRYNPDVISYGFFTKASNKESFWLPNFDEGIYENNILAHLKNNVLYQSEYPFFTYGISTGTCSQCVKRSLFIDNQLTMDDNIVLGEDLCVTIPNILKSNSVYILKKALFNYRQLETSISHKFRKDDVQDLKHLLNYMNFVALEENSNLKEQLSAYCLHRLISTVSSFAKHAKNFNEYKGLLADIDNELLQYLKSIKVNNLSIKTKTVYYCIRFKLWWLCWIMFKR